MKSEPSFSPSISQILEHGFMRWEAEYVNISS